MKKMTRIVLFVKFFIFYALLSNLIYAPSYAHNNHKEGNSYAQENSQFHNLNPVHYFEDKKYFTSIVIFIFWIILIYGIYSLIILVLSPHIKK